MVLVGRDPRAPNPYPSLERASGTCTPGISCGRMLSEVAPPVCGGGLNSIKPVYGATGCWFVASCCSQSPVTGDPNCPILNHQQKLEGVSISTR